MLGGTVSVLIHRWSCKWSSWPNKALLLSEKINETPKRSQVRPPWPGKSFFKRSLKLPETQNAKLLKGAADIDPLSRWNKPWRSGSSCRETFNATVQWHVAAIDHARLISKLFTKMFWLIGLRMLFFIQGILLIWYFDNLCRKRFRAFRSSLCWSNIVGNSSKWWMASSTKAGIESFDQ